MTQPPFAVATSLPREQNDGLSQNRSEEDNHWPKRLWVLPAVGVALIAVGIVLLRPWELVDFRYAIAGIFIGAGLRVLRDWQEFLPLPARKYDAKDL